MHDSQELRHLAEAGKGKRLYGDSGYAGEAVQGCIPEGTKNRIHEKEKRNKPLTKTHLRRIGTCA
jgi:IS5 family transposase